jgi:hypothetical protein
LYWQENNSHYKAETTITGAPMKEVLQAHYQGAELCLRLTSVASKSESPSTHSSGYLAATLVINGVTRDQARSQSDTSTLRLTSTVQTAYEWHEFIEAVIDISSETVNIRLLASSTEIASHSAPRT